MGKANCGGLILDNTVLVVVNNIITTVDSTPTTAVKANCGGVQFDATLFKNVDGVITDINADEDAVLGFVVPQQGCGGIVLDGNCFELNDNDEITYNALISKFSLSRTATNCTVSVLKDSQVISDGAEALSAGDVITISATASSGYTLSSLKVNGSDFVSGNTLTVSGNVTIVAEAIANKYKLSRIVEGGAVTVYRNSKTVDDGDEALIAGDIISFIGTPTSETMTLDTFTINGEDADIDTPLTVTEDVAINAIFA